MKKITKIIAVAVSLLALASCNQDYLNIDQKGVESQDVVYKNADDETVNSFITAAYFRYYYAGICMTDYTYHGMNVILDCLGGDSLNGAKNSDSPLGWNQFRDLTLGSQNSLLQAWWSNYYKIMYMCNLIIDNLPANEVCTPAVKTRVLAEARALRSIVMMSLVELWGNPPLADHTLDGTEGNTPAADSWNFIYKELEEVAESLPSKSGLGGQSAIGGRLTKEAVYAYLGKAYLWNGEYEKAAANLDKVISSKKYALLDDFNAINTLKGDFSDEYVFEYNLSENAQYATSQAGGFIDIWFTGWLNAAINPPDQLLPPTGFGYGSTVSKEFAEFMNSHDGKNSARYKGTLVSYDDLFDTDRFTYNQAGKPGLITTYESCTGYFQLKYTTRQENLNKAYTNVMNAQQAKNNCFMRYSEVLLNYAEAIAMGASAKSISGLEALNLVRRRAGLSDAPALDMNNDSYGVKAERRAELFCDGARFIDLKRWGDAATVLKDWGKQRYNFVGYKNGENNVKQDPSQWVIDSFATEGKGWDNKYMAFPYPFADVTANENLIQNQGW